MSTPMNPNQPQGGAHYPPQQQPAMAGGPGAQVPQQAPQGAQFTPQQGSGAPTQSRLPSRLGDEGRTSPVSFGRLFGVEMRKMVDTRAGKWLLIAMGVLIIIASVAVMFGGRESAPRFGNFVAAAGIPMGFLLPILGILTVTSEWSQRTALVTFTLEPRRSRVVLAKWAVGLLFGALSIIFAFAIGAATTLIAQAAFGHDANWTMSWGAVGGNVLAQLIAVSIGIAFGLAFQNTPAAICSYLFIPILVSIVTSFGETMRTVGEWIDLNLTTQPLYNGTMSNEGWAKFAVAHVLWLVLPMVIGFIRLNKREVKSS